MSAQLTYDQSPAIGFAGMLADNFSSPKQIDSGLAEATYQVTTVLQSTDYVALNNVVVTLDGTALAADVWVDTHSNLLAAVAAKILAQDVVTSAAVSGDDTITVTFNDGLVHTISVVTTLGAGQPTYTIANTTTAIDALVLGSALVNGSSDAQYKVAAIDTDPTGVVIYVSGSEQAYSTGVVDYASKKAFPIMKKGRFYGVAGSAVSKGASLSYHVANGKYVADGAGTTNAFVTAVTSATADGDIIVLDIDKV